MEFALAFRAPLVMRVKVLPGDRIEDFDMSEISRIRVPITKTNLKQVGLGKGVTRHPGSGSSARVRPATPTGYWLSSSSALRKMNRTTCVSSTRGEISSGPGRVGQTWKLSAASSGQYKTSAGP